MTRPKTPASLGHRYQIPPDVLAAIEEVRPQYDEAITSHALGGKFNRARPGRPKIQHPPGERICSRCKVAKPYDQYHSKSRGMPPTTLETTAERCKECQTTVSREQNRKRSERRTEQREAEKLAEIIDPRRVRARGHRGRLR